MKKQTIYVEEESFLTLQSKYFQFTHGIGCDGDRLVTVDGWRKVVNQIGESGTNGRVVFGTNHDEPTKRINTV